MNRNDDELIPVLIALQGHGWTGEYMVTCTYNPRKDRNTPDDIHFLSLQQRIPFYSLFLL